MRCCVPESKEPMAGRAATADVEVCGAVVVDVELIEVETLVLLVEAEDEEEACARLADESDA